MFTERVIKRSRSYCDNLQFDDMAHLARYQNIPERFLLYFAWTRVRRYCFILDTPCVASTTIRRANAFRKKKGDTFSGVVLSGHGLIAVSNVSW